MRRGWSCLVVALVACGGASWIHKDPGGGVIRYQGEASRAAELAQQMMAAHCGLGKYKVISEGLEPIATDASSPAARRPRPPVTDAREGSEYRVHFVCDAGTPDAKAPPRTDPPS